MQHTCEIAARPRQTENKTCADWVGDVEEYDRDCASFPEHGASDLSGMREQHVGLQGNKLFREALRVRSGRRETNFDPDIAAFRPSKFLKFISEFDKTLFGFRIVFCEAHEDGNEPDPLELLRKRTNGPCCRSATNQFDEIAPSHCHPEAKTGDRANRIPALKGSGPGSPMSALGHTDICTAIGHVRFTPKSGHVRCN